jgi:DNA-binding response OmpR family regulator
MHDATPRTILLADDDVSLTSALSARLHALGYHTLIAHDSYTALNLALKNDPDLLILDINMPAGDGFSVVDRLRQQRSHVTAPLIVVSGDNSADRRRSAYEHGAFGFLSKPFASGELVKLVRQALREDRIEIPSV